MKLFCLLAGGLLVALSAPAQLSSPNQQGVAMGHIHLNAADPDASIRFWTDVIGASSYTHESLKGVSTQGVIILFAKKAPAGPSVGSAVDHIGLNVPDLSPLQEKLAKTNYKHWLPVPGGPQLLIDGPDGVRIEVNEDSAMYSPLEFRNLELHTPDIEKTKAWYAEHFGAFIPGVSLAFVQDPAATPTLGRAIDHIGFEVKGLEAFCKKLADSGVKLDSPFRTVDQIKLSLAFLTDPWGTRIELTEGLAK